MSQMGDDIMALLASIPRTVRTLQWAVQAGIGYKRLLSSLDADLTAEAQAMHLSRLHDYYAQVRLVVNNERMRSCVQGVGRV